jgi:imidazolonepropionase-like amidohydrolase
MRPSKIILSVLGILGAGALAHGVSSESSSESKRIVIAASAVLDGRGQILHDTRIVIEGSQILAVDPRAGPKTGPVDYDLRGLTVLPGWIDAHVHITWSFGPDGKNAGQGGTTPEAA